MPAHKEESNVLLEQKPKLKRPERYTVLLHNDDFTTMDFVVEVLQKFFYKPLEEASKIMLQIHTQGVGVCGVYVKAVAESKVELVTTYATSHKFPLLCTMEPVL